MSVVLPELIENAWTAVNVPLSSAMPDPTQYPALLAGIQPKESGIVNWSGGCLLEQEQTKELVVWGGGHGASASNAIYAYDVLNPSWRCIRPPSSIEGYDLKIVSETYPDGRPVSRHSYFNFVNCPDYNALWTYGGSLYPSGNLSVGTWLFNLDTNDWERKSDAPYRGHAFTSSTYDCRRRRIISHIHIRLSAYYLDSDKWEILYNERTGNWRYCPLIIPNDDSDRLYMLGAMGIWLYNIGQSPVTKKEIMPTGDVEVLADVNISAALDTKRNRIILWGRATAPSVYAMDVDSFVITKLLTRGESPVFPKHYTGTYSRFQYVDDLDCIVMMLDSYGPVYYLRLTDTGVTAVPAAPETPAETQQPTPETSTPTEQTPPIQPPPVILVGDSPMIRLESTGNIYSSLAQAEAAAQSGDTITLAPWVYLRGMTAISKPLTIRSTGPRRAVLDAWGGAVDGKGILVHRAGAGNLVLERLEITGAKVPDTNGAGLRVQGDGTVHVRDCHFHGNENGILASNFNTDVIVDDCVFDQCGHESGQSHNLYVSVRKFIFRRSISRDSVVGHLLKSRSKETEITDSWIYDHVGRTSIAVDISIGGLLVMRRCVVRKGKPGENRHLMKYAAEGYSTDGRMHRMDISDCLLLDDIGGFLINTNFEARGPVEVAGNQWAGKTLLAFPGVPIAMPIPMEETEDQKRNAAVFEHLQALAGLVRGESE